MVIFIDSERDRQKQTARHPLVCMAGQRPIETVLGPRVFQVTMGNSYLVSPSCSLSTSASSFIPLLPFRSLNCTEVVSDTRIWPTRTFPVTGGHTLLNVYILHVKANNTHSNMLFTLPLHGQINSMVRLFPLCIEVWGARQVLSFYFTGKCFCSVLWQCCVLQCSIWNPRHTGLPAPHRVPLTCPFSTLFLFTLGARQYRAGFFNNFCSPRLPLCNIRWKRKQSSGELYSNEN